METSIPRIVNKCRSSSLRTSVYAIENGTFASSDSARVRLDSLLVNAGVLTICTKEEVREEQYIRFKIDGTEGEFVELSFDGPLQRVSESDSSIVTFSGSLRMLRKKPE